MDSIEESRTAKLTDQYRPLPSRSRALQRKYKEKYVKGLAADVVSHLNANVLSLAYGALKKLRSKSMSQASPI